MRVNAITQNINSMSFMAKKKHGKEDYAQYHSSPKDTIGWDFQSYIDFGITPPGKITRAKSEHPFSLGYFDFDKLMAIELPESAAVKPLSFEDSHAKFTLDRYQQEAIDAYNSGKTTIVSAPTGTGKTLIAEHVIKESLNKGTKIIYLSPLKALSNEKYSDFAKLFGEYDENGNLISTDNVGLLTGDSSINPDAPVMVMTTEIYRNSLLKGDEEGAEINFADYDGVIYDEFHYLGDKQRGTVWEEAVMNTPKHMKQMMLSATASNSQNITHWVGEINPSIKTHLVNVPESERHVPLREMVLIQKNDKKLALEETKIQKIDIHRIANKINLSDRQIQALAEIGSIMGHESEDETIEYLKELSGRRNTINCKHLSDQLRQQGAERDKADSLSLILANKGSTICKNYPEGELASGAKLSKVVRLLHDKKMTPALFYVFSKKGCNHELEKVSENSESLLTAEESRMVYDEVQKAKEKGVYLGSDFGELELEALMKGFAVHHAGKLPAYKSLVENLARKGLVKVCFATETLIAGINMPFKTTVFTALEKFDGDEIIDITPQIFKQGGGRAGRRGKDEIGNVIVMPNTFDEYEKYVALTKSNDTSIRSQYRISYASLLSDRMLNNSDEVLLSSLSAFQSGRKLDDCEETVNNKLELLKTFGFVEEQEDGTLVRTEKGNIAKNVYGINEIFLTELLYNPEYLDGFTSDELIAMCAAFSDVKDEAPAMEFKNGLSYLNDRMRKIFGLAQDIDNFESYHMVDDKETPYSTNLAPYILNFAKAPNDRDEAISVWIENMNRMREKDLIIHEGDFLRVVNGTIDILKLIGELSPDENIRKEAMSAIEQLKKPPVTDIFNYELSDNIQTKSEN